MEFKSLFLLLCALVNFVLGVYILWHNPQRIQNRISSLFIFNLLAWSLVNFLIATSRNIDLVVILGKLAYAVAALIPATFITFVYFFPTVKKEISKKHLYFIYFWCVIFLVICFTSLIQAGVKITEAGFRPIFGPLVVHFTIYIAGGMGYGLWLLYRKWKLADNKYEQLQIKFNFVGILIATVIALVGSLVLPVLGISAMVYLGPTVTVVFVGFITYTIVRYRLFDITVVIKKTVLYTLLSIAISAPYVFCIFLVEKVLKGMKYSTFLPVVFSAIFIAFVFLPLREKIQALVDKIFYKQKYEYKTIIKNTGKKLTKIASFPKLLRFLLESITQAMGIKRASIWLSEGEAFVLKSRIGEMPVSKKTQINRSDYIVRWLKNKKDVLIYEELDKMRLTKETAQIKNFLEKIEAEIAIPIARDEELVGIIFLGEKFMGDIFSQDDVDLLLAIASQTAVTIENARLFTEIEQAKVYQENILKNLANAVIVTDREEKVRIFNEKAEDITGLSASSVIGKNHRKVLPEIFSKFITDAKKFGKGLSSHEIEYIKDKGKPMIVGVGTAVMRGKNNKVNGVTLVLADLTEIRALEHQLNRAEELATVGTLAAGMAHEIKNPLVAINTFLELLPEKYDDPEFRGEFSKAALEEVKKINELIHRLLNFAQPKPPNFILSHIHKCIDENLKFMSTKFNSNNVTVTKKYSSDVPESFIDRTRFDEVLLNLLLNAVEAMQEGGKLCITTSYQKSASGGGEILLKIQDTGEGIPSENISRIFDPFFTTKDNGTGLGLAIVYRAITDHGGKIEVKSKVNKGTTFLIYLPVFLKESEYKLTTSKS